MHNILNLSSLWTVITFFCCLLKNSRKLYTAQNDSV